MTSNSKIEWTTASWNPVTGCDKVSPGCRFCYAETMAKRLHAMETPGYEKRIPGKPSTTTDYRPLLNSQVKRRQPRYSFAQ